MMPRPPKRCALLPLAAAALAPAIALQALAGIATEAAPDATAELIRKAYDLAYNLDHDPAIELLRRAVAEAPDDPRPHRALANILWLNMLFRRGAVTVDHYLGSFSKARVDLKKPPPELDAEFRRHVRQAVALAERQVAARPRDAQANYNLGAGLALQASYIATVEGKLLAGFRAARRSFDLHERVLEIAPARSDAGLIVGTYRYVVSTMSFPVRMMAYVVGFGGGREKGIQLLHQAAAADSDARTDALFALVLVYNRERKYDEASRALQTLRSLYPRNRLVVLEAGCTALRGGRHQEAERLLSEGLAMLAKEVRPRIPGEESLWRYKRGAALRGLGRTDAALEELRSAIRADAQAWVAGRARVELGELALARGDGQTAASAAREAETLCRQGNDPECVDRAKRLLRKADGR